MLTAYENRFAQIKAELLVLKWMFGFAIALDVAILIRVFFR